MNVISGISMFRKPTGKPIGKPTYQQNFPPLAPPKKISYSAATKANEVVPQCTMNFSAAARREDPAPPPPPVDHLPKGWIHLDTYYNDTGPFDYNKGMLRAAHIIYQRQLQYFAHHGITPLPIEFNDDDFEPEEDTSSCESSYCNDTADDDDASIE